MKKIKKQPPVRPERSETPVSQVRYVLWYERHSSYRRTTEKNLKQSPVRPVTPVTPVSQVSYASGMNGIIHTAGRLKKLNPSYALEAERTNALVGFNPGLKIQNSDLATLGFHQKAFHDVVKTLVLLSRCEAEKMLLHFLDEKRPSASPASPSGRSGAPGSLR